MRLTRAHVDFWRDRKSPEPKWFSGVRHIERSAPPSIDSLVNGHAGIRQTDGEMQAHNTLSILRMVRKRNPGELLLKLRQMAASPGTVVNPKRRAAFCHKWLRRIMQNKEIV